MTGPAPEAVARLSHILQNHHCWSIFWDKKYRVWRVTEDDPDSVLYAEDPDLDAVINYITVHA